VTIFGGSGSSRVAIDFLNVADVLTIHVDQIERYGGDPGIRDLGLLESAVAQGRATFDGKPLHEFPFETAAAYMFHLVKNHPFVDGNKRTGAAAALVFLDFNGVEIEALPGQVFDMTMAVATGLADKGAVAQFFQRSVR